MRTTSPSHIFNLNAAAKGRMQVHVVNRKGEVIKTMPWQDNLILDQGMNYYATNNWANLMSFCVAGTGTTPTRDIMDGTADQSGTTVTLTGSTYSFSAGDVNKWIGWAAGGYQAKITAYLSATQVTVDRSQTVSTATATLYRCDQVGLATEVKRTNTYPVYTYTDGRGASATFTSVGPPSVMTLRRTYDFTAEVGSVNYTEIGISPVATVANNLFARILLAGAVTVTSGQQLRITYELAITISGTNRPAQTLTSSTGWPYTYSIASITSNGTSITLTTSIAHHYVAGGSITIAGAKRTRFTISAAISTGANFTLTTSAPHGRGVGDTIIIEGMTPSGYNGTWTTDTGTTGSTIVVTTGANPGTGTVFGNVRQAEPGTWYDGTWTIASVGASTVVITSAITPGSAGADGTAKNNLGATMYINYWPCVFLGGVSGYGNPVSPENSSYWQGGSGNTYVFYGDTQNPGSGNGGSGLLDGNWYYTGNNCQLYAKSTAIAAPAAFPIATSVPVSGGTAYSPTTYTKQTYTAGTFYRDHLLEWSTATANSTTIRGLIFAFQGTASSYVSLAWYFNEPQRKDSTNRLRITYRQSWSRILA